MSVRSSQSQEPLPGALQSDSSDNNNNNNNSNRRDTVSSRGRNDTAAALRRVLGDVTTQVPTRMVFPIQIGDRLFRLSGTSLASDGEYINQISRTGLVEEID